MGHATPPAKTASLFSGPIIPKKAAKDLYLDGFFAVFLLSFTESVSTDPFARYVLRIQSLCAASTLKFSFYKSCPFDICAPLRCAATQLRRCSANLMCGKCTSGKQSSDRRHNQADRDSPDRIQ